MHIRINTRNLEAVVTHSLFELFLIAGILATSLPGVAERNPATLNEGDKTASKGHNTAPVVSSEDPDDDMAGAVEEDPTIEDGDDSLQKDDGEGLHLQDDYSKTPLSYTEEQERQSRYCRTRPEAPECLEYRVLSKKAQQPNGKSACPPGDFSKKCIEKKNEQLDAFYRAEVACNGEGMSPTQKKACKRKRERLLKLK